MMGHAHLLPSKSQYLRPANQSSTDAGISSIWLKPTMLFIIHTVQCTTECHVSKIATHRTRKDTAQQQGNCTYNVVNTLPRVMRSGIEPVNCQQHTTHNQPQQHAQLVVVGQCGVVDTASTTQRHTWLYCKFKVCKLRAG